jgi:putative phosphoesterase
MKIGLISDPHATPAPVAEALALFRNANVDAIYCLGDIAGYGNELDATVDLLIQSGCHSIIGNHDEEHLALTPELASDSTNALLRSLPASMDLEINGVHVHLAHACPPDHTRGGIRLLDQQGERQQASLQQWQQQLQDFSYDVLIVGHTHQVFAERLGDTLVINPGSTLFNHSCAILSLPDGGLEWFALSGQPITATWNWSDVIKFSS